MKHQAALGALCLSALAFFSGCAGFNPVTEELMRPPRLTEEQKAIEETLKSFAVSSEISFKYPKAGDYRSAYIFHDVDGDGEDEALVFYTTPQSSYARMTILDHTSDGKWFASYDLSGPQPDVEFISFAHITDRKSTDLVIGWSGPNSTSGNSLGVYSLRDNKLINRLDANYNYESYLVDDLDLDGIDDILLFTPDSGTHVELQRSVALLSFDGYHVSLVNELPLSTSIQRYANVNSGKMTPGSNQRAAFVDEQLVGNALVTEVFTITDGLLSPLINSLMTAPEPADGAEDLLLEESGASSAQSEGEPLPAAEPADAEANEKTVGGEADVSPPTLYERTRRSDLTIFCRDINNDGAIEIPVCTLLPGYEEQNEAERIYQVEYNQYAGGSFQRILTAAINRTGGYMLQFPDKWIGAVTIDNIIESGEWRIIAVNPALDNPLDDPSGELARVRVVSQKDYQDKFLESYRVLGTRSAFTYYGFVPETAAGPLAVTLDALQNDIFKLL